MELLKRHGFDDIVVTVAFQANAIRTYFGNGSEFGVRMVYATEENPLGTAGSVRNAMDELHEPFLVISGDVVTDIDLAAVVDFHLERKGLATIALKAMENPLEFGIVIARDDGSIERFLEKPSWGQVFSDTINTGIYVLQPEIFEHIEAGKPVDFSADVFPRLLDEGVPLFGYVAEGYWEDVGTLDAYIKAHQDVARRPGGARYPRLPAGGRHLAGGGVRDRSGGYRGRPGHHRGLQPRGSRRPAGGVHRAGIECARRS